MNGYGAVPEYDELESYMYRDKRSTMTREEAQRVLDLLSPGRELPPPRTEEEFILATSRFVTVSEQTRLNVLKMLLTGEEYEQVVALYEKSMGVKDE